MNALAQKVVETFTKKYSTRPQVVARAPGRVNIIGEHTDYTGGFVLPAAIDRDIVFAVSRAEGSAIHGHAIDFNEDASIAAGDYNPQHPCGWMRYVMGVLSELEKSGKTIGGFRFCIGGNVPVGSGLSSSAALEMATCTAMEGLFNFSLDDKEAALLTQRAENNFVGVNCGIMDQYISRVGQKEYAVMIDCADLSNKKIRVNTPGYSWIIVDSMKRRGLVDSEYNKRRKECEKGITVAQEVFGRRKIGGLRDLSVGDLDKLRGSCEESVFKRVKHVLTENNRVIETTRALDSGDIEAVGRALHASHASLRDDFEVSCEELDTIVSLLGGVSGVAGARLTGAGFGGCVIALVKDTAVEEATQTIRNNYHLKNASVAEAAAVWRINIADGARLLDA